MMNADTIRRFDVSIHDTDSIRFLQVEVLVEIAAQLAELNGQIAEFNKWISLCGLDLNVRSGNEEVK